jgi:hypothetical protein
MAMVSVQRREGFEAQGDPEQVVDAAAGGELMLGAEGAELGGTVAMDGCENGCLPTRRSAAVWVRVRLTRHGR